MGHLKPLTFHLFQWVFWVWLRKGVWAYFRKRMFAFNSNYRWHHWFDHECEVYLPSMPVRKLLYKLWLFVAWIKEILVPMKQQDFGCSGTIMTPEGKSYDNKPIVCKIHSIKEFGFCKYILNTDENKLSLVNLNFYNF